MTINSTNMIKASELRIGNLVEAPVVSIANKNGIQTIEHHGSAILKIGANNLMMIDNCEMDLKPIPITEKWLERFGFKKTGESSYEPNKPDEREYEWYTPRVSTIYDILYLNGSCKNGYTLVVPYGEWGDRKFISKTINYIHELQNLWFSLSGEELTLKQPIK